MFRAHTQVLTVLVSLGIAGTSHAALNLGDVTPNFTKLDLANQPVSLYDYRGQVVVLNLLGYS